MSMDFTSTPTPADKPSETPLFTPNPVWERHRTKRRFGGRAKPSTAATAGPVIAASSDPDDAVLTSTMEHPMPYTGRTTTKKKSASGVSPVAILAGVVALGALAGAGWYAMQPRDNTVAQLTPGAPGEAALSGSPNASAMSTSPSTAPAPTAMAQASPPRAAATTTTTVRTARADRVRPAARAATPAATGESIDASGTATLPGSPQPYAATTTTTTTVTPAPTAVNPPTTPPVEPAPQPSASSATPATPPPEQPATPETTPPQ